VLQGNECDRAIIWCMVQEWGCVYIVVNGRGVWWCYNVVQGDDYGGAIMWCMGEERA
jgi:hypothetical protein